MPAWASTFCGFSPSEVSVVSVSQSLLYGVSRLARRRIRYTRESHEKAMHALTQDADAHPPIPVADQDQAALESLFLQELAEVHWSGGGPRMAPFGILWVSPSPSKLDGLDG